MLAKAKEAASQAAQQARDAASAAAKQGTEALAKAQSLDRPAVTAAAAAPAAPTPRPAPKAIDLAAAAKAFENVPREELIGLLAKTNGRCRELEHRYAELKGLHQQVLEERRQLVVTKGKSGISLEAERESVEAELHASYRDRVQELEEAVASASSIKGTLQVWRGARSRSAPGLRAAHFARTPSLMTRAPHPTPFHGRRRSRAWPRRSRPSRARAARRSGAPRRRATRWRGCRASAAARPPRWRRRSAPPSRPRRRPPRSRRRCWSG